MILLHEPFLPPKVAELVQQCLDSGWISSAGPWVKQFEAEMASFTGAAHAIATQSGTAALHVALQLAGVTQGDWVILPALGYVAAAHAAAYLGADPIFVDVKADSWQMDGDMLGAWLAQNTRVEHGECIHVESSRRVGALVPIHTLGYMADPNQWLTLAERHYIPLVEDAAEAVGSSWNGQHAGTFGRLGVLSFNGNKTLTTGGGGMILTDEPSLGHQALHLTTQAKLPGMFYEHDQLGYNYRMTSLSAAMGLAQLSLLPDIHKRKGKIYQRYLEGLGALDSFRGFPLVNKACHPNYWLNTIRLDRRASRDRLLALLPEAGIQVRPLWQALPTLPPYQHGIWIKGQDYSVAQSLVDTCVSLPSSPGLTEADQTRVIETIKTIC